MTGSSTKPRRENPRTRRVREIVLAEGLKVLIESGGEAVTAVRLSERTGVARSTIYRHWPDPASLLLDVVVKAVRPSYPTVITQDLRHDLRKVLIGLRTRMERRGFRAVFATLLAQATRDEAFAAPQKRLVEGVLLPVREVLDDARSRGRLPESLDVDSAAVQLAGPVLTRHVMMREDISDAFIEGLVEQFVDAHQLPGS
ncbi:MAG: TetR/AcrR family transcriptional regulator [Deltaproteobacteria bacterium]|nr:TetR/AcrR family transcriptional regulator [Deltaproteobacteria bacterium]